MKESQWTIGADPSSDLWINHPDISRYHCLLIRSDVGYVLRDSHSTNGTFCNGNKIDSAPVSPEDQIMLAGQVKMPWPDPALSRTIISIGFDPQCDYRINDKSVSGRHAELFADPNGQWVIRDLDSTNGTWVGTESIKATALAPTDTFRVGTVQLSANQVVRKVSGKSWFPRSLLTPSGIAVAASSAAVACLLAWLALRHISYHVPADTDRPVASADLAVAEIDKPNDEDAAARPGVGKPIASQPTAASDNRATVATQSAGATDSGSSSNVEPSMTETERVTRSLFVIADRRDKNLVSIATAWAVSPSVLITNGHVVESIDKNNYKVQVIHLASGKEFTVTQFGYHQKYTELQTRLAKMITEIQRLQQDSKQPEAPKADAEQLDRLVQQGKAKARAIAKELDAFDAGWLRIENQSDQVVAIRMKTVPVEPSKALRLAGTHLEADSAIFVRDDRPDPQLLPLRASDEPIVHQNKSTPIRWSGQFRSAPDQWSDYHFAGCPVVSLRGRIVGMCCGFSRRISSNDAHTQDDNSRIDTIDIVPFQVIEQMVQRLTKQGLIAREDR